ncbi:MAG: hypothetical protein ACM3NR_00815 [Methanosarcina sp.]
MKRTMVLIVALLFAAVIPVSSQSRFIKNVAKDVKTDILGSSSGGKSTKNTQPEPKCACNPAEVLLDLKELNMMYSEISLDALEDGSFLVRDRITQQYYIVKDGSKKGPFTEDSPQVAPYISQETDENADPILLKYKSYITKSANKYTIKFNGKSYGPYAAINQFVIPKSGDKFAALVTENIVVTEDQGDKMEEAMKKAKTDQEKMDLAMKFSQEMSQKMMAGGGPMSTLPKLVTSIPDAKFDPMTGGTGLNGTMKYDEVLATKYDQIIDMKGNKVITLKPEHAAAKQVFVNTTNTKYAWYDYGTLNFSDGTTLSELFNPHLIKSDGKVYLAYLYYSPAKNAIMRCKILF